MGVPPPIKGTENTARAGSIFDPNHFRGNCQLFRHLNEVSLSMLKKPITNISSSIKIQKGKRRHFAIDEYGILLPEED